MSGACLAHLIIIQYNGVWLYSHVYTVLFDIYFQSMITLSIQFDTAFLQKNVYPFKRMNNLEIMLYTYQNANSAGKITRHSLEPSLLAHTSSESRGTFRQKARSLAPLNGWACAVNVCHDGMLEDTNSLDGAQLCYSKYTNHHRNWTAPV